MATVLLAANEGFLKAVPLNKIADFEAALLSYMNSTHSELMKKINKTGEHSAEVIASFKAALTSFVATQTW